ncbi:GTPase [Aureococcus anophagefferens]|nr:GTPase [Aureococcus anophagefferens]
MAAAVSFSAVALTGAVNRTLLLLRPTSADAWCALKIKSAWIDAVWVLVASAAAVFAVFLGLAARRVRLLRAGASRDGDGAAASDGAAACDGDGAAASDDAAACDGDGAAANEDATARDGDGAAANEDAAARDGDGAAASDDGAAASDDGGAATTRALLRAPRLDRGARGVAARRETVVELERECAAWAGADAVQAALSALDLDSSPAAQVATMAVVAAPGALAIAGLAGRPAVDPAVVDVVTKLSAVAAGLCLKEALWWWVGSVDNVLDSFVVSAVLLFVATRATDVVECFVRRCDCDGGGASRGSMLLAFHESIWSQAIGWSIAGGVASMASLALPGEDQGRTRERNSQLQSLISRPFSTREDNVGGFDFALVNAPAVTFVAGIVLRWLLYRVDAAREKQARKAAEADEAGAPPRAAAKLERRCRRAAQHLHLTTLALGLVVGWSYEEACSMLAAYRDGAAPSPAPAEGDVEDAAAPAENPLQDDDARRDTAS